MRLEMLEDLPIMADLQARDDLGSRLRWILRKGLGSAGEELFQLLLLLLLLEVELMSTLEIGDPESRELADRLCEL